MSTDIPAPVARCLERTGASRRQPVARAVTREHGTMCLNRGGKWVDFTADQWFAAVPPSFSWRARIATGILPLSVTDEFVDGRGRVVAGPFGLPLRTVTGPECDQGELARWLASSMLFPTVWLFPALRWQPVDDRSARVTLSIGDIPPVELTAEFPEDGVVAFSGRRSRAEGRSFGAHGWRASGRDFREVDGLSVPHTLESAWIEDDGTTFLYYRGELDELTYE
jgi:hypothetical protein